MAGAAKRRNRGRLQMDCGGMRADHDWCGDVAAFGKDAVRSGGRPIDGGCTTSGTTLRFAALTTTCVSSSAVQVDL
ncbi:MAG: hypothetical protein BGP24_07110 [Lysobacterales bacterium 69-70]|nr:MAG: hypothetical protein BGP24_07110 [Xanthomonadales bacterium 69-70]